ncbi:zonular occludens toxin domain-containing protein [Xanthomonas axonopodis]
MIYQFTGQPGHGKSLHALDLALKFKDEGRVVYAGNIRQLDYAKCGLMPITPDQFKDWPAFLPDGAVCLIDECYEHDMLPKRGPGAKVPHWVEQLAKHRHRGLDFIFVCQSPAKQMDTFVHDLIEKHTHVRRRFGMNFVHLRIFDRYESRPEKAHPLMLKRVRLPKRPMGMYQSTELDTTKRGVPWYYYAAGVLLVLIIGGVVFVANRIHNQLDGDRLKEAAKTTPGSDGAAATARPGGGLVGSQRNLGTRTEYARLHEPRFGSMPWTAPAYDQREVTADPELYCMSSLAGRDASGRMQEASCTCFTEQGTRYELDQPQCRTVARHGAPYNPYGRRGQGSQQQQQAQPQQQPVAQQQATPGAVVSKGMRTQGTFPESPQAKGETFTGPTTLEM